MGNDNNKNIYNRGNGPVIPPEQSPKNNTVRPFSGGPVKDKKKWSFSFIITVIVLGAFIAAGAAAGIFIAYMQEVPEVADLKNYKPNMSTALYDQKGNMISQLYDEQRTVVKLSDVPVNLQNAIIAKEDPRFFQHGGFDIKGIFRAAITDAIHMKIVEGASTITQQLARNLFLDREKTFSRKIKEAVLALQIERFYTKKEILELYCNQIYFGSGAHGVEAAARTYFGKHVYELTLQECAMLAALPQAPSEFNPYLHPNIALEKRNIVLDKMAERGFITDSERDAAKALPIELNKLEVQNAPYFVEYVREQLEATYGSSIIYKGGLRVDTTLDSVLQNTAQEIFNNRIKEIQDRIERNRGRKLDAPLQGAMLAMDPKTGEILVMIGGVDFSKSEFNRSTQALRQTGSSFKPIVYASAIASGFRVSDVFMDSPIVFKNQDGTDWKPESFSGKFSGPMILLNAITYSKNVDTVRLMNKVGIGTVKKYARLLGITSPLANDLTLGLGSSSLSLLEMVSAFSALANGGSHVEPLSILSVKDSNGKNLEVNTPKLEQVIPDTTAYITTYMLENVVNRGTGRTIRNMGFNGPCAGKTGTTNDFTDAWYIGYTPDIVVGIWIGFDSKQTMGKGMVGGSVAAPIWGDFMLNSFSSSKKDFPVPDNIIFKKICTKSGMLATTACTHANTIDAPFVEGTEPLKPCTYHSAVNTSNFLNEDIESSTSASDDWDEEEAGVSIKYNDVKSKKPAVDDSDEENVRVIKQKDIGKSAKTPASSKSAVPVKNSAPANKPAAPAAKTSDDDSGYGGF